MNLVLDETDNDALDVRGRTAILVTLVGLTLAGFAVFDSWIILLAAAVVCGMALGLGAGIFTFAATVAVLALNGATATLWAISATFALVGAAVGVIYRSSPSRIGALGRSILVFVVCLIGAAIATEVFVLGHEHEQVPALQDVTAIAAAAATGALLSQYRQRREFGRLLTAPLAAAIGTLASLAATLTFWSTSDGNALKGAADSAAVSFVTVLTEQSNIISTKVSSENAAVLYEKDFPSFIEVTVLGQPAISSASLVALPSDAAPTILSTVTEFGDPHAEDLASWVQTQADTLGIVAADSVQLDVGIALLDTVLEPRQYFYVVAAPLPLVDRIEERPTILLVTLSLDSTLQTAAATATANESSIQLDFVQVLGDTATILASTDGQSDGRTLSAQDLASVGPAQQAAQIILGDIDFRIRASYGSLDLLRSTERRLVLLVEALVGLALAALVLSLRLQSDRRDHERIRREALLSAALRGSPGWTAIIDGDNRVEMTNDGPFHVPQGDLVESSTLWGEEPETVSNLRSLLARARTGEASEMQVLWSDPHDVTLSMRIVEVSARPMPGVRLVLLQCIDVTEMRDRAMRTSQSERMEAIGVLAGGLAHDFNNLLFITLGYLQMLERQPIVAGDQQARTYVGRAVEAVERGAKVAKSLLSFARSQPLAASRVDLDDYIKDLTPLIEQAIGSAHQLRIDVEGQLGVVVDPGRLSSALLNVVFNARDAMETKGQLTLRIAKEMAAPLEQDPRPVVAISISDTGKGMPPEVAARAFEPFFTTKKVGSGTGLGLATLYSFAQQSGGWAAIDSTEGVGTTISLYLPPADEDAGDDVVEERDATLTTRALVIDDEPALADLVSAWLGDLGIATRTANTPEAALRVAREFKPQLVMSDANLNAELDGLEVARLLVEEHPSLIVVFMTGFSDRIKALQAAGVATLAKPFSREDLLATLSKTAGLRWERGPRG